MSANSWSARVALLATLVLTYLVLSATGSLIFAITGVGRFDVAVGMVVPVSMLFGGVGIAASVVAILIRDMLAGVVGTHTAVVGLAHCFGGYVSYRLATSGTVTLPRDSRGIALWLTQYLAIAVIAGLAIAAVIGWGSQLFGLAPYFLALGVARQYVLMNVLFGAPLLVLLLIALSHIQAITSEPRLTALSRMHVGAIIVAWFVLGSIGSIGYYNLSRIPAWALHDAGIGMLAPLGAIEWVGPGAVHAQTVLAAIACTALVLVHRSNRERGASL